MFEQQPDPASTPQSPDGADFTPTGNRPAANAKQATPGSVLGQGPSAADEALDFLDLGSEFGGGAVQADSAPAAPAPVTPQPAEQADQEDGQGWLMSTEPAADEMHVLSDVDQADDAGQHVEASYEDAEYDEHDEFEYDEPEPEPELEDDTDEDGLPASWVEQPGTSGKARKVGPKVAAAVVVGMLGMTAFYMFQSRGGGAAEVQPLSPELNTTPGYERRVVESASEGSGTGRRPVGGEAGGVAPVTEVASAEPVAETTESFEVSAESGALGEAAETSEPVEVASAEPPAPPIWELTGQTVPPGATSLQESTEVAESSEPSGFQGETILLGAVETTEVAEAETTETFGESAEVAEAETTEPFGETTEVAEAETVEPFGETTEVAETETFEPFGETTEVAEAETFEPFGETTEVAETESVEPFGETTEVAEAETVEPFGETTEVAETEAVEPFGETTEVAEAETVEPFGETTEVAEIESVELLGETTEVAETETVEPFGETTEVAEAETVEPFGETTEVAETETVEPFGETTEVAETETVEPFGETTEVAETETVEPLVESTEVAEVEATEPVAETTEVAQAETGAAAGAPQGADPAPGTYGPALPAGISAPVVERPVVPTGTAGTFRRTSQISQSTVLQTGRGPRNATPVEMKGVWMETTVPMEGIFSSDKLLTPRVGQVRVVLDKNEIFEGRLYAVGKGKVWIDNKDFGQLALDGKRVQRVLQLDNQENAPELGAAGSQNLAGFDRVRVKTPGGTIHGKVIARDERNTTLLTDDGARITLDSSKVEFLSEAPAVALKHIEQERAAREAEKARLERVKPEGVKDAAEAEGADEQPVTDEKPAPVVAGTGKP